MPLSCVCVVLLASSCLLGGVRAAGVARNVTTSAGVEEIFPTCLKNSVFFNHRAYSFQHAPEAFQLLGFTSLGDGANTSAPEGLAGKEPHRALLPLSWGDVFGFVVAAISLFLAAGGGIGGGGVLVPLYILGMHFNTASAICLSNLTIAGGAIANLICNIHRRHPSGLKPLIDWDLILVMEPLTICGAILGGFLNKLLPTWFTDITMTVLLFLVTRNLLEKGFALYKKESIGRVDSYTATMDEPLLVEDPGTDGSPNQVIIDRLAKGEQLHLPEALRIEAQKIVLSESRQVPYLRVCILFALFGWLLCTDTLKDSVKCGGLAYWLLVLSIVPVVALLMFWFRNVLVRKGFVKSQAGLSLEEGDIEWTPQSSIKYPVICSFAGVVAGLFGVGGGIVKGPLMLEMGVLPEVAAATSATMILFTSGSASVVYMTFGGIQWDYAGTLMVMGFLVTLAGQQMTYCIIERLGRRSIIIFAMASLLGWGCVIMGYESFAALGRAFTEGFLHIVGICAAANEGLPS